MKIIKSIKLIREETHKLRRRGRTIGFVPTMGALHEGHLSLVRESVKKDDITVVSIYVNPLQFGPKEDLKKYPRPIAQDLQLLKKSGADMVFLPDDREMYPEGFSTLVDLSRLNPKMQLLSEALCGKFRPGHFRGVLTVVAKLFNIVTPDSAYFGAKDYQQVKVIERLNTDLNFGIRIYRMPTLREPDGLAMSSRNQYLSVSERAHAGIIPQVLFGIEKKILAGDKNFEAILKDGRKKLAHCVDQIQYLEIVDADTLESLVKPRKNMVAAAACYLGKTRLIDNVIIQTAKFNG